MSESYLRLRQVCLVAPALEPVVRTMADVFGIAPCYRDLNVAKYGLENALWVFGHQFVEVVAPTREGTAAGRFLERYDGQGGYMAIFDCSDNLSRLASAQANGVRLANEIRHAGYHGLQLHPRDCRAAMLEFSRSDGSESLDGAYHPAGPDWQRARRPDLAAAMPAIEVCSPEPAALAAHWGAIAGLPVGVDAHGAAMLHPDMADIRFVERDGPELLSALTLTVGDPVSVRAAAARAGLVGDGAGFRFCGVRIDLRAAA